MTFQICSAYSYCIFAKFRIIKFTPLVPGNVASTSLIKNVNNDTHRQLSVYSGQYKFNVLFSSMSCVQMLQQSVH